MNLLFEGTGYEYSDCFLNLGTLLLIMVVGLVLILCYFILSFICCFKRSREFFKMQLSKTFFNRILVFVEAEILVVTTCCWINLYQVSRGIIKRDISFYFSIVLLSVISVIVIIFFIYLLFKADKLDPEDEKLSVCQRM